MLHAILHELQTASGPMTLRQLSRKLGVQESALEGMIQFWVRKGRLVVEQGQGGAVAAEATLCSGAVCGLRACPGPDSCPLLARGPAAYHLPTQ